MLLFVLVVCTAGWATTVGTTQNPITVNSGQSFSIGVDLLDSAQIRGYSLRVAFDPNLLHYNSSTRGSLFNGMQVNWWRTIVEEPGLIRIECVIFGAGLYVSGPGRILNMNFSSLAEGSSAFRFLTVQLADPLGNVIPDCSAEDAFIISGPHSYAKVRAYLEGPYSGGQMQGQINSILPLLSLYPDDPVLLDHMPETAVDWGLIELRQAPDSPSLYCQSILFHTDGSIRSAGKPYLILPQLPPGNYHLALRHRNHIDQVSNLPLSFVSVGSPNQYELITAASFWGNYGLALVDPDTYALASGDADQDNIITSQDRNDHWRLQAGKQGYLSADFNLDGNVFPDDLNLFWRQNLGFAGQPSLLEDTDAIELTWGNPKMIYEGGEDWLSIDILAKVLENPAHLGSGLVLLNYDPEVFSSGLVSENRLQVQKGELLTTAFSPLYTIHTADRNPGQLAIVYEFTGSTGGGNLLSPVPQVLLNLRLKTQSPTGLCILSFETDLMQDNQFTDDNFNRFSSAITGAPLSHHWCISPRNIRITLQNEQVRLQWDEVPGCSYDVFSTTDPQSGIWLPAASGLTQNNWLLPSTSPHAFFRIIARDDQSRD